MFNMKLIRDQQEFIREAGARISLQLSITITYISTEHVR